MYLRFFSPNNNDDFDMEQQKKLQFHNVSTDSDNSTSTISSIKNEEKIDNISEVAIQKLSAPKIQKLRKINNIHIIKELINIKNLHPIAKGSYGTVYKGLDMNDKMIAVKSIPFSNNGIECLLEASIMKCIVHPYINIAHSITLTNNSMNIVQTLASSDLHTYCRSGEKISKKELKKILWQITQAVCCLHKENIIHGDLKAQNILVFGSDIKLCDFTLSIKHNNGDYYNDYTGTPTHRCPSVWMKKKWGISSDIWSLGCTFYEIIKGKLLFPIQDKDEDLKKSNLDCIIDFCRNTGQEVDHHGYDTDFEVHRPFIETGPLKNLLLGMLQWDPEKRFTITEILQHPYFSDQPKELNYVVRKNEIAVTNPKDIGYARDFYSRYNAERATINTAMNLYQAVGEVSDYGVDIILLACLLISSKINYHQQFNITPNKRLYQCEMEICKKLDFRLHCELV